MGNIITVTSGISKTGKTTVTAVVSSCLAVLGYKTLCIDFGNGKQNLGTVLGISDIKAADHIDVLGGQNEVINACTEHPTIPGLFFLSTSTNIDLEKLDSTDVKPMFDEIRHEFNYCFIDTPSVNHPGFKLAHADADMSIQLTTGEPHTTFDTLCTTKSIQDTGVGEITMLAYNINMEHLVQTRAAVSELANAIGVQMIGIVPHDDTEFETLQATIPLMLNKKESKKLKSSNADHPVFKFMDIARFISENAAIEQSPDKKNKGSTDDGAAPVYTIDRLLSLFGDPKSWAQSTLKNPDLELEDLFELYIVMPGMYTSKEAIKDRMWLHDMLDDAEIPYHIEIGSKSGNKGLIEVQRIFVEKNNAEKAVSLIKEFNDPGNVTRYNPDMDDDLILSEDGIPQMNCASCGELIDFDYHKCPYCNGYAN